MTTRKKWLTLSAGYVITTNTAGTETYVHRFNRALLAKGIDAHATFYADCDVPNSIDGVPCHALRQPSDDRSRHERFAQLPLGLGPFEALLRHLRPDVVHVNDCGPFASLEHLNAIKRSGAAVVATYHSPGFSCPSHALLYRRRTVCDGELRVDRCTRCCLAVAGLPLPAAALLSVVDCAPLTTLLPPQLHHPLERRRGNAEYIERWHAWIDNCDVITYAASWIRDVLVRNGVSDRKLMHVPLPPPLLRDVERRPDYWNWARADAFRLLFAGRVIDTKGTHVLIDAIRHHLSEENVALCIMGIAHTPDYARAMERAVAADDRIRWYPPQPEAACLGAQIACDAVVVPSLWPETGPYSVLEAQWLNATVIGSDRAGIAELLRAYSRGFLFRPSDARALADAVKRAMQERPVERAFDHAGYTARFDGALNAVLARLAT